MIRLAVIIVLILSLGCNTEKPQLKDEIASVETKMPKAAISTVADKYTVWPSEPYELKLGMNKLENGDYDLFIKMHLFDGAHYVSPNAKRDFKGKFTIFINDTDKLETLSELLETPRSVEEFDPHPFVDGYVNWVRVNTTYNQKLRPTAEEDFFVTGLIQFTIEPRCTLEKVPFFIKYADGEMRAEIDRC